MGRSAWNVRPGHSGMSQITGIPNATAKATVDYSDMQPKLSVGLIVGEMRQQAEQNLAHLLAQTRCRTSEIVGRRCGPGRRRPRRRRPPVGPIHAPARPRLLLRCPGRTGATGLRRRFSPSSKTIPSFSRLARAVLAAFEDPRVAAVNYAFTNVDDARYSSRSILMAEYSYWMSPHPGDARWISRRQPTSRIVWRACVPRWRGTSRPSRLSS